MDQTLLEKYGKIYGTRFTKVQKQKFLDTLTQDFTEMDYTVTKIKGKKLLTRSHSYFFGNIKNMKTLIVVPYDTPERKFWFKTFYYPFDGTKTLNKNMIGTFVPLILLYLFIFGVLFLGKPLLSSPEAASVVSIGMFLLVLLLIYMMAHGIRNKHNAVRYSASISTALAIAKRFDRDEKKRVAFLFTDKNKTSFLGAQSSIEELNKSNKKPNIICLDAIGSEDTTMIGYVPQNRKMASEVAVHHPLKKTNIQTVKLDDQMRLQTPFSYFQKAIVIASGRVDSQGCLLVSGTAKASDKHANIEIIQHIEDMVYAYLHSQK